MPTLQKTFPAMGTVHTLTLYGTDCVDVANRARDAVLAMDRAWSVFRTDSELSALNRSAGDRPASVGEDTMALLQESVRLCKRTDGAFDVTAGALSALWRRAAREDRLPTDEELRRAVTMTDARSIRLDASNRTAYLPRHGQSVDFGGIAKGYAADRLRNLLQAEGIADALLNLGGTVAAIGRPAVIGIRNPLQPNGQPIGTLRIENQCAVTSGSYERYATIRGKRYHHIIDPRTGMPADAGLLSVTLVGKNGTALDALATAVFVLGIERGLPILNRFGVEAIFVTASHEVLVTDRLAPAFSLRAA